MDEEEVVKIRAKKPRGCYGCPFRHWVYDHSSEYDDDEYDICGITGEDIPYHVNCTEPDFRMSSCKIVWE